MKRNFDFRLYNYYCSLFPVPFSLLTLPAIKSAEIFVVGAEQLPRKWDAVTPTNHVFSLHS